MLRTLARLTVWGLRNVPASFWVPLVVLFPIMSFVSYIAFCFNGDISLTDLTVLDDGVEDKMTRASALDWFSVLGPDRITEDKDDEFIG